MRNSMKRLGSIILCLALVLALMSMGIYAADTTTLYCSAPAAWTKCNVYWWGSADTNPNWPGMAMTKGADGIWYYEVPSDATNVIFNNGSGAQSADLVMPTDENVQFNYVAKTWSTYGSAQETPEIKMVTVYVEAPSSWGTPNAYFWGSAVDNPGWPGYPMTAYEGNVYSYEVPEDITGLIFNGAGGQTADLTIPTGDDVMFSVGTASWGPLVVKEPVEVTYSYVVAGSEELCGTAWDVANADNEMTVSDNVASITFSAVAVGEYEFKVVKVGSDGSTQWFGVGEANVSFAVTADCDVTVTMDLTDNTISVAGDGVGEPEPPAPVELVTVYVQVPDSWGTPNVYWWGGTTVAPTWPGSAMTHYEGNVYTFDVPVDVLGMNFNSEAGQTEDLTVPMDENVMYSVGTATWGPLQVIDIVYTYVIAGSEELCGTAWDTANTDNEMVVSEDSVSITYSAVAAGEYEFKVVKVGTDGSAQWFGWGDANVSFTVETECDVTITMSLTDNTIAVTGAGIPVPELVYYLRGDMNEWGATDVMELQEDGTYAITMRLEAGTYEYKAAVEDWTWVCPEVNASITLETACDVTFVLDVDGYTVTATCVEVEEPVVPVVDPGLVLNYPTLSFEDEIIYNVYFSVKDMTSVVELGLMVLPKMDQNATIADAVSLVPGYVTNGVVYLAKSEGIPAANMGDTLYFKVYAKLTDGSYAYSTAGGYNAKAYANSILKGENSAEMKALVVSMLNYGAEAQLFFGHNTDKLVNNALTAEQQALISAYDATMMDAIVKADTSKTGNFVRVNSNFRSLYPSVSFDGAFAINFYCMPAITVDEGMTLYYWDMETMASVDELTVENATGSMEMTNTSGMWWGQVAGIAAKQMDKTYYVSCVFESDGETVTTGVIPYSLGKYCSDKAAADGDAQQAFAQATAVYGFYAKNYFASIA